MRRVLGTCPSCGMQNLALTGSGAIVCCDPDCERPTAAGEVLADQEVEHLIQIERRPGRATGWKELDQTAIVKHPLRERLDDGILACTVHDALDAWSEALAPGLYRIALDDAGGLIFLGRKAPADPTSPPLPGAAP